MIDSSTHTTNPPRTSSDIKAPTLYEVPSELMSSFESQPTVHGVPSVVMSPPASQIVLHEVPLIRPTVERLAFCLNLSILNALIYQYISPKKV